MLVDPFGEEINTEMSGSIWIGHSSAYNPQCEVRHGPSRTELEAAFEQKQPVQFQIFYRTADMEDDEPDEHSGECRVLIGRLEEVRPGVFGIMGDATGSGAISEGRIWIWDYEPDSEYGASADFEVW